MRKLILFSFLALVASLVFSPAALASSVEGKKVIIDPGHGGDDPGTTQCIGYDESQANLDIALILADLVETNGGLPIMTRITNDVTLSNEVRYTLANENKGDALVSIHLNGSLDHTKNGTLGLYAKIKKDKAFTEIIHNSLVESLTGIPNLGITNFMSGVTLKSEMPATMQEAVYLSNTEECGMLRDGDGSRQTQIAQAIFDGLEDWFSMTPVSFPKGRK